MRELLHDPINAWLFAGALIIALEAFTAPGLGFFLGGLGAICTSIAIKAGWVGEANIAGQFAWCFGINIVWTGVLWKPMRKFRMKHKRTADMKPNNLIGETAIVAKGGLKRGEVGQVLWSGTLMNAELERSSDADLPEGAKVSVHAVSGNTLKVTLK